MRTSVFKSIKGLPRIGAIVSTALAGLFAGSAMADDSVTLKAVFPINPDNYVSAPIALFKDFVEERTDGKVKVKIIGADEVIPSANQFEALQNGVVDVILGMTSYYSGVVPEGMVLLYSRLSPAEQRETGLFDLLAEAHHEKGGVMYYAHAGGGPATAFRYYLKDKVESVDDFADLKIRASGSIRAFTEALGAAPVSIPFSDVYMALDRGLVDGFGTTYAGITFNGLHEVTKYVLDHPFYSMNDVILINEQTWNSIPEETRAMLVEAAPEFEKIVEDYNEEIMKDEDKLLVEKGMELIQLPDADREKFYETAYSAGWAQFLADNPVDGEKLKALAE